MTRIDTRSYPTNVEFKERRTKSTSSCQTTLSTSTASPLRVDPVDSQEQDFFRSIRERAKKASYSLGSNTRAMDPPETKKDETTGNAEAVNRDAAVEAEILKEIARLEAEAEKKRKAAELAIENAKSVLKEADSDDDSKEAKANNGTVSAIAQMIAIADQELSVENEAKDDRVSGEEKREGNVCEKGDRKQLITIVSPPSIKRQFPAPASDANRITNYYKRNNEGENSRKEEGEANSDEADEIDQQVEASISMLTTDDDADKGTSGLEETLETLESKIAECTYVLSDPNASVEEQTEAAQLMVQYARTAKAITKVLQNEK